MPKIYMTTANTTTTNVDDPALLVGSISEAVARVSVLTEEITPLLKNIRHWSHIRDQIIKHHNPSEIDIQIDVKLNGAWVGARASAQANVQPQMLKLFLDVHNEAIETALAKVRKKLDEISDIIP